MQAFSSVGFRSWSMILRTFLLWVLSIVDCRGELIATFASCVLSVSEQCCYRTSDWKNTVRLLPKLPPEMWLPKLFYLATAHQSHNFSLWELCEENPEGGLPWWGPWRTGGKGLWSWASLSIGALLGNLERAHLPGTLRAG
jgi:hypothetical protein